MASLTIDEINDGDRVVILGVHTLPDQYDDLIGDVVKVNRTGSDEVFCTTDDGRDLVLLEGEVGLPDEVNSSYYKQKQKLNL